jgi:hypothetical protein
MKKPNDMNTLLSLPIDAIEAKAMFGEVVVNAEELGFDISKGSPLSEVMYNFGCQLETQGFLKWNDDGDGSIEATGKEGDATFSIPCWGVMEVGTAILAMEDKSATLDHLKHLFLWDPFMQKANRIMEFGATEESAGGENFLSMN